MSGDAERFDGEALGRTLPGRRVSARPNDSVIARRSALATP
jgi:hypothetical protein